MNSNPGATESVVRHHLSAFLEEQGLHAILSDFADDAILLSDGDSGPFHWLPQRQVNAGSTWR